MAFRLVTLATMLLAVGLAAPPLCAQSAAVVEEFEGPEPSWRQSGADVGYRLVHHRRVPHGTPTLRGGEFCEYVELSAAANGTHIYFGHDVGRLPVIDELRLSLSVSANRPGAQLLARVVLPRAVDPRTQQPLTTLIAGTTYGQPGQWQQLQIADCPALLQRRVWVLRAESSSPIDTRGAYIDRLLLNAYAGEGRTQLWIDNLLAEGSPAQPGPPTDGAVQTVATTTPALDPTFEAVARDATAEVQQRGPLTTAGGRPLFPRMIDYQGEPLSLLRGLGFNAIWLDTPPRRELLDEAASAGIWLVCPPPVAPNQPVETLGPWFQRVLAWNLGSRLTAADVPRIRAWADAVRASDQTANRPLVAHADADLRAVSRQADILRIERRTLGTGCELAELADTIRRRTRLARPGTPAWVTVGSQLSPELVAQARLFASEDVDVEVEPEQLRLLAYSALAAGARGLHFRSHTPLDRGDPATLARAAALEQVNLDLELVEAWAANGTFRDQLASSVSNVRAALLQTDRGQLLLPMAQSSAGQIVAEPNAIDAVSIVVPGVPESSDAYWLSPAGLRPLRSQRVTGGIRLALDEFSTSALVVLTQDPAVVAHLTQRLAQRGRRMAELEQNLAAHKYQRTVELDRRLASAGVRPQGPHRPLAVAAGSLQQADRHFAQGNLHLVLVESRRATHALASWQRTYWEQITHGNSQTVEHPLTLNFGMLPDYLRSTRRLHALAGWQNLLPAGDVEHLPSMLEAGWRHVQHPVDGVRADVELSTAVRLLPSQQPSGGLASLPGRHSLRIRTLPVHPDGFVGEVESPPVWVTTPEVEVQQGQLVRITGWLHIPQAIAGSTDGLLVLDSMTGEALAARFQSTTDWRPFTLYRVAPHTGPLSVTFALCGVGEALLDDLTIDFAPGARP